MKTKIIGFDPGIHGAIAVLDPVDESFVFYDMPTKTAIISGHQRDVIDVQKLWENICPGRTHVAHGYYAFIEKPPIMIARAGEKKTSPNTAHGMGYSFGLLEMICVALGIPYKTVAPNVWKPAVGLRPGAPKSESIALMKLLYPQTAESFKRYGKNGKLLKKENDDRAEAGLIVHWGYSQMKCGLRA